MISTGGIGEVFFLYTMGNKPDDVIRDYHLLIGKPVLYPRWALGWHHGRFGNKNISELNETV